MLQYGHNAYDDYISSYGRSSGRKDLLTKIISHKTETGEAELSDLESYTEIANLVFAGTGELSSVGRSLMICSCPSDTTSTTLTYLFWELARDPSWQHRVRQELLSQTSGVSYGDIQSLTLLDAIINEALRLHPAAPASLPRETPPGGKMLGGHFIPEKVR
jgi:cytochrome P450